MFYFEKKRIFLSDGENLFINNLKLQDQIPQLIGAGVEIIPLTNDVQKKQDYCGSSAAAIAVTFLQKYNTNNWTNPIHVPNSLVKRISRKFHKYHSIGRKNRESIKDKLKYCRGCRKRFFSYRSLTAHEAKCRELETEQ